MTPAGDKKFDDGEPKGTVGLLIYTLLQLKGQKSKVVVIARYFGGKKLGASGLVRAYRKAASKVL